MQIPRGYGFARAIFEKKENPSSYIPKAFSILCKDSKNEIENQIIEELFFATESGAICLDLDFFIKKNNLTIQDITPEIIENLKTKNIIFINNKFYFKNTYEIEQRIIQKISILLKHKPNRKNKVNSLDDFTYSRQQIQAVKNSLQNQMSLITGGPGTGKTTVIRLIVYNLLKMGYSPKKLQLVSPTGKAARRLGDSLGKCIQEWDLETPTTLHRLLGYKSNGRFYFNSENPLLVDVLIIDEASMIDIYILDALLSALPSNAKLILVGDPNQLLSVHKGSVFSDLVQLKKNVSEITKVYRQKQESKDLLNLIKSIQKEDPKFLEKYKNKNTQKSNVNWIETNEEKIYLHLKTWYEKYRQSNSQILTHFNLGKLGVEGINKYFLQEFPENPPMILNINLSKYELFNGDLGFLFNENGNYFFSKTLDKKDPILLPSYILKYFSYAFAITIHKSQGSEYDHVCLVLPPIDESGRKEEILTKRLVYTAITRAKKSVTIIGNFKTWEYAIQNYSYPRMSGIVSLL